MGDHDGTPGPVPQLTFSMQALAAVLDPAKTAARGGSGGDELAVVLDVRLLDDVPRVVRIDDVHGAAGNSTSNFSGYFRNETVPSVPVSSVMIYVAWQQNVRGVVPTATGIMLLDKAGRI